MSAESSAGSDRELLEMTKAYLECRARGMDPSPVLVEAWEQFYRSYEPRLRAFLEKCRLADADLEDCLQDVWVEVVAHLGHFQHDPRRGRLSTWLTTLARNKAVDSIRRRSRHSMQSLGRDDEVPLADLPLGPEADCERRWAQARVRGALAKLADHVPVRSFRVLYLRWIEDRNVAEIATALDLTPDQVRLLAHRMKERFRDVFERYMTGETFESDTDL